MVQKLSVAVIGFATFGVLSPPGVADACGGFFVRSTTNIPSLSAEQVLIIHDEAKGQEHFVREVVFQDGDQTFGFVVPVPSRPEVAAVKKRPFAALDLAFPMNLEPPGGGGIGGLRGAGKGSAGDGVTVLEVKQVGSFKAFVLAANDTQGLRGWLDQNQFTTTPESERWLDVYVKQRFFFVAMRHDPPEATAKKKKKKRGSVIAETIRLSFATPVPYYPYREPEHAAAPDAKERLVGIWLVTDGATRVPVAVREVDGKREIVRPFREGMRLGGADAATVTTAVGDELKGLVPTVARADKMLNVQVFEDQKVSRRGFGDVLFVGAAAPGKPIADARRLETILDPSSTVTP